MRRNVEVVSCDFCGEDIEGKLATAKVREMGVEPKEVPVRLYNQLFFCYGVTRYSLDICPKCQDKVAKGEICVSTDLSVDRRFANG